MKVKLINPEEAKRLYINWGIVSDICYSSNDDIEKLPSEKLAERIGKSCKESGHFSGSRAEYIKFRCYDMPRSLLDQLFRGEQGIVKNMRSFRYVNASNFKYAIPKDIEDNEVLVLKYNKHMEETKQLYIDIQEYVKDKTNSNERANEQARHVIPMSTFSACTICFDIEALIHMCNERLCTRAEDEIREFAKLIREETLKILPDLKDDLVPNCQRLLYCPEGKKSCGLAPIKAQIKELISQYGYQYKNPETNKYITKKD